MNRPARCAVSEPDARLFLAARRVLAGLILAGVLGLVPACWLYFEVTR